MASQQEVISANSALPSTANNLTAVFVGATKGIGLATLRAFASHTTTPKAIVIGRNASAFSSDLESLRQLNPKGDFTFLEADISLIRTIDDACKTVKQQLGSKKIDLLYLSQGSLPFAGRVENSEGLDNVNAVRYYGRVRFTQNLLPLMSEHARIVSVLAGSQEGKIVEDDLELKTHYSLGQSNDQVATLQTLSWDHLAAQHAQKTFIHVFPGLVSSGLLGRSATGVLGFVFRWVVGPLTSLFFAKPESVGERMLYYGTSAQLDKGSLSLNEKGEEKEVDVLKEYRAKGWATKAWEHNEKMFESALSR